MRNLALMLFVLLVGSNAVWWFSRDGRSTPARSIGATQRELAAENRALRRELEQLKARGPASTTPAAESGKTEAADKDAAKAPDGNARAVREAPSTNPRHEAWVMAQGWARDALQLKDARLRATAIEEMRAALASDDSIRQLAGLMALPQLDQLSFDKESFRPLILPFFERTEPGFRRSAIYALYQTGVQPGDLDLILSIADDPGLRESITHAVRLFNKGRITGRAADAVLEVLASDDHRTQREAMRGIWGATVSPEVEARLLEIVRDPEMRSDAIYFGLSTLANKSEAVVDLLIEAAVDPDPNVNQRARWGLASGIATDEGKRKVSDFFLELLKSDARVASDALAALSQYGTAPHLEALELLASAPETPASLRERIESTVLRLRRRLEC